MRSVLAATGACLALAACGDDDSGPSLEEIEKGLARDVQETTGTRDVTVSCPDDVAEGDVCDITAAGGVRAQVRVTRLEGEDADGEVVQP